MPVYSRKVDRTIESILFRLTRGGGGGGGGVYDTKFGDILSLSCFCSICVWKKKIVFMPNKGRQFNGEHPLSYISRCESTRIKHCVGYFRSPYGADDGSENQEQLCGVPVQPSHPVARDTAKELP